MLRLLLILCVLGVQLLPAAPAAAQSQPPQLLTSGWLPGPNADGFATYAGAVDQPTSATSTQLTGWVVDTSAQGWSGIDDVQIWDGLMQAGGHLIVHPAFQLDRPDVAAALGNPFFASSGFAGSFAASPFGHPNSLYVYAHTPAKGWWYLQVIVGVATAPSAVAPTLNVEVPTSLATVHSNAAFTMRGFAFDPAAGPDQGTGVDRIQVYLDGDRGSGIYIGDAKLGEFDKYAAAASGGRFPNAGWELTFQPNSWMSSISDNQLTRMTVYARSSVTGAETKVQTTIVISVP